MGGGASSNQIVSTKRKDRVIIGPFLYFSTDTHAKRGRDTRETVWSCLANNSLQYSRHLQEDPQTPSPVQIAKFLSSSPQKFLLLNSIFKLLSGQGSLTGQHEKTFTSSLWRQGNKTILPGASEQVSAWVGIRNLPQDSFKHVARHHLSSLSRVWYIQ